MGLLGSLPAESIGGLAATVQAAGISGPGLYQLNVVVPRVRAFAAAAAAPPATGDERCDPVRRLHVNGVLMRRDVCSIRLPMEDSASKLP